MNATGTPAILLDRERSALDLPVAGLAALAVAFAAFTIPDALLGRAVEATGLPSLLTAAQPPLGNTARLSIAVAGAVVAFFATFLLLGWLDRFASRGPAPVRVDRDDERAAPRINRADAHPDAPPRRPISAARDLGEPAPPSPRAVESRPAPVEAPVAIETAPPEPKTVLAKEMPSAQVSPRAVPPVLPVARPAAPAARAPAPQQPSAPASLGDLMARLEQGLARREREAARAATPAAAASPAPSAPPVVTAAAAAASAPTATPSRDAPSRRSDRLQSAIDGLRALSA